MKLRDLMKAATPGPWVVGSDVRNSIDIEATNYPVCTVYPEYELTPEDHANAALIAYLRNHAEALAELVESARKLDSTPHDYGSNDDCVACKNYKAFKQALAKLESL